MSNRRIDRMDDGWLRRLIRRIWEIIRGIFRPVPTGPSIDSFRPIRGCPGVALEIIGKNFAPTREDNHVTVGGAPAHVIEASATCLKIITSYLTKTGSLEAAVGGRHASGPVDFQALGWPNPRLGEDGPPILYTGFGQSRDYRDMPSTGDLGVLIVLCHSGDLEPDDPDSIRNEVDNTFDQVRTYYRQVSYERLDLIPTVTTGWCPLDGNLDDLSGSGIPPQAADFAAREALGDGCTQEEKEDYLANFTLIISVVYTSGEHLFHPNPLEEGDFLQYNNPEAGINIELRNHSSLWSYNLLDEAFDWKVWAHEIGHKMVSCPVFEHLVDESGAVHGPWRYAAILGEDLYPLPGTPTEASAATFDLMGHHYQVPLFSAYYMDLLGYYNSENISSCSRSENPEFNEEFLIVAHGVSENESPEHCHLVKIQVAPELLYYIEVRQLPDPEDPESQVFDAEIRLPFGETCDGGVVVTKVFTGTVNMNQKMRFITLMRPTLPAGESPQPYHPVLKEGEEVVDPARNLKITVIEYVRERPLTCRVRVEWFPVVSDETPPGDIRLWIRQWNANYVTPDIWINRLDNDLDSAPGRSYTRRYDVDLHPELELDPEGSMDRPRVDTINEFWGRVHCDGPRVEDVKVTFYVVTPPGVGDNGNWAPIATKTISSIDTDSFREVRIRWTPEIGEHTCLKLYATAELPTGEKLEASAQENVFEFLEASSGSIPDPVVLPLAVRNPCKERLAALISVRNVPEGFVAHFPHAWVWLDPLQERRMALTIIPTRDYGDYQEMESPRANIKVNGWIPRYYREEIAPGIFPPPCLLPMGGILARVTPKRRVSVRLWENQEKYRPDVAGVLGELDPAMGSENVTVDLEDPAGRRRVVEVTTDSSGRFAAVFDLKQKPNLEAKSKYEEEKPLLGVYVAQAFIVNSPHAAQAESNAVYIEKK